MSVITRLTRPHCLRIVILVLLTLALTVGLAVKLPVQVQAQSGQPSLSSLIPEQWEVVSATDSPDNPRTNYREAGSMRCFCCMFSSTNRDVPIALVPLSGIGKTVAEYPTLFLYLPKTTSWGIEFVLKDANNEELYSTKYAFTHENEKSSSGEFYQIALGTPGIISLTIPSLTTRPPLLHPLKIGEQYHWHLTVICDPNDPSSFQYINGIIERVPITPKVKRFLAQATPRERFYFYTKQRIWYETLGTLIEMRRERPDDQDVADAWNKLLKSVNFEEHPFLSETNLN